MNKPVTLYLADDHQIVIDGLKLLISNEESMRIVGYAYDGETACAEIQAKQPDIALVDFSMPKLTGLDLILSLKKKHPIPGLSSFPCTESPMISAMQRTVALPVIS